MPLLKVGRIVQIKVVKQASIGATPPLLKVGRPVQIKVVKQASIGATPEGRNGRSDKGCEAGHH